MRKKVHDDSLARARFARVRLVNEELDRLAIDAAERTASVSSKASFLAVSSGVLVAAATAQLWTVWAILGVIALALSCLALFCAAVALRPGKRQALQAQRLVDRYVDSTLSAAQIESTIVHDKATVLVARETDLRSRSGWVWVGFGILVASAVALTLVFAAEIV